MRVRLANTSKKKDHLGRALVTLDANRDGLVDVAISHLYEPLSLLVNRTQQAGNEIAFYLKSTTGQRDGIGTSVTLNLGDQEVTTQLTGGDGYMCSSERKVVIGTGKLTATGDIHVRWASGQEEQFSGLQCGADYLLIEGSGEAFALEDRAQPSSQHSETTPSSVIGSNPDTPSAAQEVEPDSE